MRSQQSLLSFQLSSKHLDSVSYQPIADANDTLLTPYHSANAIAQLLTVPPYAVAAIVLTTLSYASDRMQSRGIFIACSSSLGGIGYL